MADESPQPERTPGADTGARDIDETDDTDESGSGDTAGSGTAAGVSATRTSAASEATAASDDEVVDALPDDLNAAGYVGPYMFPDNNRRRIPGYLYLGIAAGCAALWATVDSVYVNGGFLGAAVLLAVVGLYQIVSGWNLDVDEQDALVAASRQLDFPVGHASAQMGWRGLLSRPTWRILLYSSENPPRKRGLVLVDGVNGSIVEHFVEDNPEDWSDFDDA